MRWDDKTAGSSRQQPHMMHNMMHGRQEFPRSTWGMASIQYHSSTKSKGKKQQPATASLRLASLQQQSFCFMHNYITQGSRATDNNNNIITTPTSFSASDFDVDFNAFVFEGRLLQPCQKTNRSVNCMTTVYFCFILVVCGWRGGALRIKAGTFNNGGPKPHSSRLRYRVRQKMRQVQLLKFWMSC